jgi:hypothetical protein
MGQKWPLKTMTSARKTLLDAREPSGCFDSAHGFRTDLSRQIQQNLRLSTKDLNESLWSCLGWVLTQSHKESRPHSYSSVIEILVRAGIFYPGKSPIIRVLRTPDQESRCMYSQLLGVFLS